MKCESIYHEPHEHEDGMLIERAHALQDLAERLETEFGRGDDYDLLMTVSSDLHHADYLMERLYEFGQILTASQPPAPMFIIEELGGGRQHPTS